MSELTLMEVLTSRYKISEASGQITYENGDGLDRNLSTKDTLTALNGLQVVANHELEAIVPRFILDISEKMNSGEAVSDDQSEDVFAWIQGLSIKEVQS